jgi:hypothetical protein
VALAAQYGRYGYRRITQLLKEAGWDVGTDRVQRIWRREGLKVPWKQKPRSRLWLNDGSCIRLRPERRNHVWSYDFVEAQTHALHRPSPSRNGLYLNSRAISGSGSVAIALLLVLVATMRSAHAGSDR